MAPRESRQERRTGSRRFTGTEFQFGIMENSGGDGGDASCAASRMRVMPLNIQLKRVQMASIVAMDDLSQ